MPETEVHGKQHACQATPHTESHPIACQAGSSATQLDRSPWTIASGIQKARRCCV